MGYEQSSMRRTRVLLALLAVLAVLAACTADGDDPAPTPNAVGSPRGEDSHLGEASPFPSPDPGFEPASDWFESGCNLEVKLLRRIRRDYHPERSPEIVAIPQQPNYFGGYESTSHSGPWDYIQRVPLVFYGPGFIQANGDVAAKGHDVTVADMAPTLAGLLGVDWPSDRPGVGLDDVVVPEAERDGQPKVVVTIVWDGGGWDVLETWPDEWPFLRSLMEEGTSVTNATSGSSPSVTPAIHANIGTGAFPKQHGIVDIPVRDGASITDSWPEKSPQYLAVPTLADLYDPTTGNVAEVGLLGYKGWHLGMLGHGAYSEGGDHDLAALINNQGTAVVGNENFYELPSYLEELPSLDYIKGEIDAADGKRDDLWLGHDVLNDAYDLRHETPAFIQFQTDLTRRIWKREGYGEDDVTDLFFINYKPVDSIGHTYNMVDPEVREAVRYADQALEELAGFLDKQVGKDEWVIALTADHGQTPHPTTTGAWAVDQDALMEDAAEHFDLAVEDIFQEARPTMYWLDPSVTTEHGITPKEIADYFLQHTIEDNGAGVPERLEMYGDRLDEPVLAAAFPTNQMGKIWSCAKS